MPCAPTLCRNTPLAKRRISMFRTEKRAWKCFDLYVNTARSTRCCWRESAKRRRFGYMLAIKATDAIIAIWRWILPSTIEILNNLWLLWVERLWQEHIIAPTTSAIEGLLGSAMDGLLDEIGLDNQPSKQSKKKTLEADSI